MDQDNSKNIDNIYEIIDPDYESTNTAIRRVELQEEEGMEHLLPVYLFLNVYGVYCAHASVCTQIIIFLP